MNHVMSLFKISLLTLLFLSFTAWAQESSLTGKLYCPYCGIATAKTSKFCDACGAKLPNPESVFSDSTTSLIETEKQILSQTLLFDTDADTEARLLYQTALHLIAEGEYASAQQYFKQIIEQYPDSQYAKESALLAATSRKLELAERQSIIAPAKKKSGGASFGGAFLGSVLGLVGGILIISAAVGS